jgi:hypothetical protein
VCLTCGIDRFKEEEKNTASRMHQGAQPCGRRLSIKL